MKNNKTTAVGVLMAIAFLGLTAAFIFGKIDASGYGIALGAVSGFGATVIGFLAADGKPKN